MDVKGTIIGVFIPLLLNEGAKGAKKQLDKIQEKEPEWHKTGVVCGHRLLKGHLDEVIEKTENKYDDSFFDEVIEVLEEQASTHGYALIS